MNVQNVAMILLANSCHPCHWRDSWVQPSQMSPPKNMLSLCTDTQPCQTLHEPDHTLCHRFQRNPVKNFVWRSECSEVREHITNYGHICGIYFFSWSGGTSNFLIPSTSSWWCAYHSSGIWDRVSYNLTTGYILDKTMSSLFVIRSPLKLFDSIYIWKS